MIFPSTYIISVAGQELLSPGGNPAWFVSECYQYSLHHQAGLLDGSNLFVSECYQSEPSSPCRAVG